MVDRIRLYARKDNSTFTSLHFTENHLVSTWDFTYDLNKSPSVLVTENNSPLERIPLSERPSPDPRRATYYATIKYLGNWIRGERESGSEIYDLEDHTNLKHIIEESTQQLKLFK